MSFVYLSASVSSLFKARILAFPSSLGRNGYVYTVHGGGMDSALTDRPSLRGRGPSLPGAQTRREPSSASEKRWFVLKPSWLRVLEWGGVRV